MAIRDDFHSNLIIYFAPLKCSQMSLKLNNFMFYLFHLTCSQKSLKLKSFIYQQNRKREHVHTYQQCKQKRYPEFYPF